MRMFPAILSSLILAAAFASAQPAVADDTIKIGEINSYSAIPSFTEPYRKGWQLALDEINAAGGVDGNKLEVISKDDGGKPADAVTAANELVANDGVAMLAGTFFSNIGLAVSDYAKQKKILFLAAEPLTDAITLSKGNRYTFRLRPGTYEQAAMLADEAAKLPAKKWATIAPNYEYGQSAVAAFKKLLSAKRPDIVWVGEQWPPQAKIDAGAVAEAIAKTEPDAIFNVTFGADLVKLVREGETRGLFKDRAVVSVLAGEPEYLDPLKDETPQGWIVTGYPWSAVSIPDHAAFLKAYQAKFNDYPRLGSVVGYAMLKSAAAILAKAKSTDREKLADAAEGVKVDTPFGPVTFRAIDHQSTLGAFVGKTALKDGKAGRPAAAAPECTHLDAGAALSIFPNLRELRRRTGARMSGGEQQMLTIVRTLMGNPSLLLLDEPSEGLAPRIVEQMIEAIREMKREGLSLFVSEQNLAFARLVAERVYVIEKGAIRFGGTMAEFDARPDVRAHLAV